MLREPQSRWSGSGVEATSLMSQKSPSDVGSESDRGDMEKSYSLSRWTSIIHLPYDYLCSTPWGTFFIRFVVFFIPSFLQGRHARDKIRPARLSPTAYLDGMRGLAALFVYFCHYSYQAFSIAEGWGAGENNYHILKLPILRLWYQGPAAVCVFFVISGYALSYRPLKLIRSRAMADFSTAMSSLVFRRAIRLFVPPMISTFMVIVFLRLGVYEWTRDFAYDVRYMKNVVEAHPDALGSLYDQMMDWMWGTFQFVYVFAWDEGGPQRNKYDVHLWTIPIEFRCSLYLFLVMMGTARLRTRIRFITVAAIMTFVYRNSRWDLFLFLCGMVIAETDLIRGAHVPPPDLPVVEKERPAGRGAWLKSLFWFALSILGLYLMSYPDGRAEETPGWIYLSSLVPDWVEFVHFRYWQSVGAIAFVVSVSHSPAWQSLFNTAVVQYFGKIAYALYLMHGPVMHMVGYHWEAMAYRITGVEGHWYNAGFVLGACFCVPTVVWWADVFWRAVDIPTVKFAKWFENKCISKV